MRILSTEGGRLCKELFGSHCGVVPSVSDQTEITEKLDSFFLQHRRKRKLLRKNISLPEMTYELRTVALHSVHSSFLSLKSEQEETSLATQPYP